MQRQLHACFWSTLVNAGRQSVISNVLAGLFHDARGTVNCRLLPDGQVVYGVTCNVCISLSHVHTRFSKDFTMASFEDLEWCFSARRQGVQISYDSSALVEHRFQPGFGGVFRQFQRYGAFQDVVVAQHPEFSRMIHLSDEVPPGRRSLQVVLLGYACRWECSSDISKHTGSSGFCAQPCWSLSRYSSKQPYQMQHASDILTSQPCIQGIITGHKRCSDPMGC